MGEITSGVQIGRELLRTLYEDLFAGQGTTLMDEGFYSAREWPFREFRAALDSLSNRGLAEEKTTGPCYAITPPGVLHAERERIVPEERTQANGRVRTEILKGYPLPDSAGGTPDDRHYAEVFAAVAAATGAPYAQVEANHEFLVAAGCIDHPGSMGFFCLTDKGILVLEDWRQRQVHEDTFRDLQSSTDPHRRGREFQTAFGALAEAAGWRVAEGVTAPGEEIDLFLAKADAFCSVECRWKNKPVEAKEARDFIGKLRKRAGVFGLLVSMSGFTDGVEGEVVHDSGSTPTVLFGPEDVERLFTGKVPFDELLNERKHAMLAQRRAIWA